MLKGLWCYMYNCYKIFNINYLFCKCQFLFTKKSDEYSENKDIPQQSFLDIGNILLQQGSIDLLEEPTENAIIENIDIPEQSFLDLGKTLLENTDSSVLDK